MRKKSSVQIQVYFKYNQIFGVMSFLCLYVNDVCEQCYDVLVERVFHETGS